MDHAVQFIKTALHSRDGQHRVLTSEWVAADENSTAWMNRKMKGRLPIEEAGKKPASSGKRKSNRDSQPVRRPAPCTIFASQNQPTSAPHQPTNPGGQQQSTIRFQLLGANSGTVDAGVMLGIIRENNRVLMEQMRGMSTLNAQALQSQGVVSSSTKLSARQKLTLQAATGCDNAANDMLAAVYKAADGPEGKNDDTFYNEMVSIMTLPVN